MKTNIFLRDGPKQRSKEDKLEGNKNETQIFYNQSKGLSQNLI